MIQKYRKPYRIKKKKSIFKNRFFWLSLLFLIVFGTVFYSIFFSPLFQINNIKISGSYPSIDERILKERIQRGIEKKVLFIPTQSIFLANLSEISENLSNEFALIDSIKSEKEFPGAVSFEVIERTPSTILVQGDKNYYLDQKGVVFKECLENALDILKIENLIEGKEAKIGENFLTEEELKNILDAVSKIKGDLKIPLVSVSLISSIRFDIRTLEGWDVYFNLQNDIDWQITKLKSVLEEKIPSQKRKELEYIDVRFGNQAFFK